MLAEHAEVFFLFLKVIDFGNTGNQLNLSPGFRLRTRSADDSNLYPSLEGVDKESIMCVGILKLCNNSNK